MREVKGLLKNSVIVLTAASSFFFVQTVSAETQEEIQSQRSDVQSNIDEKESEMEKLKEELIELNEKIIRLDEAISDNEAKIEETENEITNVEADIAELNDKIEEIQQKIDKRNEILKERISSLQENGGSVSYMEVLLGATDFLDFIDRASLVHKITQADQDLLESQEQDKLEIEKNKSERNNKLSELEAMKKEFEEMQEQTIAQQEQNEELKDELKEKEEENEDIINDLKIEDEILEKKEKALREAQQQRQAQELAERNGQSSSSSNEIEQYASTSATPSSLGSGSLQTAINAGRRYIGNSVYVFGAGRSAYDVANGRFDCSGFVSWAFRQAGTNLPSSTSGLSSVGSKVSTSNMKPGDLVFFNTYKTNGHVGIYVGNNKFIGAQNSTGVAIADMNSSYWSNTFSGHVRRVQ